MTDYFIMCARAVENNAFIPEPGPTLFLKVPEGKEPSPSHAIDKNLWQKQLRSSAIWGKDSQTGDFKRGDILVFVHGYNNRQDIVMKRHARLKKDLIEIGYKGEILSFDWPSDDKALNYMEDRHDAKLTAMQ